MLSRSRDGTRGRGLKFKVRVIGEEAQTRKLKLIIDDLIDAAAGKLLYRHSLVKSKNSLEKQD